MSASITPQLPNPDAELGRANFEAFAAAMAEWMPAPPEWEKLSPAVRAGWIAGARAVRQSA